jgi:catechol 2,3-dioxygenase-like lactoylglutathione lyase family enzyme
MLPHRTISGVQMKRFHVHVAVTDIGKSIAFYSAMFGERPTVAKPDYAKWMLEDPRINFAISNRGNTPGVNHLGLQAEDDAELEAIHANLQKADTAVVPEKGADCCYAKSDKYWVTDPQGIAWESFRSLGTIPLYGSWKAERAGIEPAGSCGSGAKAASSCCAPSDTESAAAAKATGGCCAR